MKKKVILVSALLASLVSSGVMADDLQDAKANAQEAKTKAEQALEKVNEIDKKIQPMQTDLEKYKGTTDELKTKLKEYDTVKGNAEKAAQHETTITDLNKRVAAAERKVDTQLGVFQTVGQGVIKKADEAKQKAEEADGKVTALDGKVNNMVTTLDQYKDKTDTLETKLKDYDTVTGNAAKAAQHDAKIAELTGKVSAAEQKVDTQLEAFRNVGNGVKDIANAAKQKAEEVEGKVKTVSDKADSAANKVGDLEAKLVDYDQVKEKANKAAALDQKIDNTKTDLEATIKTVDEKVTKLGNPEARIKEVEKTFGDKLARMEGYTNKGLAKVTALSGLHPLGYDAASKWNISVATGHYKSENAIAMGAFFRPNRNVLLSFAGTVSGGDDAYTFGASIRVGRSGHKEMSGASEGMISATEFYDIVGKLQDEIARQKQEIEALKNR